MGIMKPKFRVLKREAALSMLPDRDPWAHKGDFGKILLLCGSVGYTGSVALAAMGALRTGAGLVYVGVPEAIYNISAIKLTEPVVFPLPDKDGKLSKESIPVIDSMMERMDAILIGPGLGLSDDTQAVLFHILQNAKCPVVVDADGITLLKENIDILRGRTAETILTPHHGEFKRIAKVVHNNISVSAELFAQTTKTVVVLKGHETFITDGYDGYKNVTGNPGMAVCGCGDMLAGMIVSLLGQGLDAIEASACAVWLHGEAGDACVKDGGQYALLPTDMLNMLPKIIK